MDANMIREMSRTRNRGLRAILIVFSILIILAGLALVAWKKMGDRKFATTSDYQSVFLSNGQVYFGKLQQSHGGWIKLSDIYYLQVTEDLQPASSGSATTPTTTTPSNQQQKINLVKLGSELHGPTDEMYIAKDKILFWENMKDDSKVLQSIKQAKAQ